MRERDKEKRCYRLRVKPRFPAAMDRRDTLGWLRLQGGGGGRHVALLGRGRQTQTPGLPHLAHHLHVHPSHPVSGNNLELLVKRKIWQCVHDIEGIIHSGSLITYLSIYLCLMEKTHISLADPASTLNKRNESIAKCRHRDKLLLKNW